MNLQVYNMPIDNGIVEVIRLKDHSKAVAEAVLAERKRIVEILESLKGTHNGSNIEMMAWVFKNNVIKEAISKIEEEA
jgi:hypothetical protein